MIRSRLAQAFLVTVGILLTLAVPVVADDGGDAGHGARGPDHHPAWAGLAGGEGRASGQEQPSEVERGQGRALGEERRKASSQVAAPGLDSAHGRAAVSTGHQQGGPGPQGTAPSPASSAPAAAVPTPSLSHSSGSPARPAAAIRPLSPASAPHLTLSAGISAGPLPVVPARAAAQPPARPRAFAWPHLPVPNLFGLAPQRPARQLAPTLAGLGAQAATLPLFPAGIPALLGMLMLVMTLGVGTLRRRRNHRLTAMLGAQLGVSPRTLEAVPARVLRRLSDQVAFDELTGVMRRAAGMAAIGREIQRAVRSGTPLGVAFIDVDSLKAVNDGLGHAAGDDLLRRVASTLQGRLRGQDLVFRYGGDEFVCLLSETDGAAARRLMERIRKDAAATGLQFSVGTAALVPGDDARSLMARADEDLYVSRGLRSRS